MAFTIDTCELETNICIHAVICSADVAYRQTLSNMDTMYVFSRRTFSGGGAMADQFLVVGPGDSRQRDKLDDSYSTTARDEFLDNNVGEKWNQICWNNRCYE